MPPFGRDDSSIVDELLQQGLTFFAANRVEQAVARWRQVLELSPGEPRALDYLASAGHPFAEGTGQSGTPVGPSTRSPDTGEIEVFEVAPISHRTDWPRHPSISQATLAQAKPGPSRASILAPWLLIAVLVPVVGYLVYAQLGGRSEPAAHNAAKSVERAQPALSVPPASQPAPAVVETAPAPAAAPQVAPAPAATPADETYVVTLTVSPPTAIIKVDGQQVARGEYIARLRRDGVAHTVEISAPRYQTRELTFVDQAPPERVRLLPDRAVRSRGRRALREARRDARGRDTSGEKAADKSADKGADKGAPVEAAVPVEQAQPETPKAAAPARKSDNINPWSSTQ